MFSLCQVWWLISMLTTTTSQLHQPGDHTAPLNM